MAYSLSDFTESLDRVNIDPGTIARVLAAWGESPEDFASWSGGFIMLTTDGRVAVLTGWCDTTGWGCQDGATLTFPDNASPPQSLSIDDAETYAAWLRVSARIDVAAFIAALDLERLPDDWDDLPEDINLYLREARERAETAAPLID